MKCDVPRTTRNARPAPKQELVDDPMLGSRQYNDQFRTPPKLKTQLTISKLLLVGKISDGVNESCTPLSSSHILTQRR